MSSATPLPYNVRFDADLGQIVYEFQSGWIPVPLGDPALAGIIFTTQPAIIKPSADAVNAINFTEANGSTSIFSIDSLDRKVGIATTTPSELLTVNGNIRCDGQMAMGAAHPSAACLIDMINPFVGLGIPAMTAAQKTAISPNRAGNLIYQTDGTPGVYVNGGSSWSAVGGGGGSGLVLRVLSTSASSIDSSGNTTGFDASANYTVSITPASSASRFLVQVSGLGYNDTDRANFSIMRGSTEVSGSTYGLSLTQVANTNESVSFSFLDSPATASPIVYSLGLSAKLAGVGTSHFGDTSFVSTITVTELAS